MARAPGAFGDAPDEHIQIKVAEGHPKLTVVAREGDPASGVAVAVVSGATPRANLTLALVVEARIDDGGFHVGRRVDREAFFLTTYASGKSLTDFFGAAQKALSTPITQAELERAETRVRALGPLPIEPPELGEVNRCLGKLAMVDDKAASLADVERARVKSFADAHVSFAIVGPDAAGKQAEHALVTTPEWPKAQADEAPSASPTHAFAGRSLAVPRGSIRVSVALPVADPRVGAGAAERIGQALSPLRAKLQRLRIPFALDEVGGVTKPHGGCLFVTATSQTSDATTELPAAAAFASALIQAELAGAAGESVDPTVASRQVLRATDPVDAATIAAWWALASPASGSSAEAFSTVLLDADSADTSVTAAREALLHAAKPGRAAVSLKSHAEPGQGELWMAIADPCAVAEEVPHQWGTAALVAIATSLATPELEGVAIESFVDPRGVGIVAHAAPRKGESPTDLTDRVAGAAAAALFAKPVTSDGLLQAQSIARGAVERAWGHETLGLVPFAEAVAPEHPTLVEPLGSFAQVSRGDAERGARRWRSFAAGGVTLGVLSNAGDAQAAEAEKIVGRWLAGAANPGSCAPATVALRPGRAEVHGSGSTHSAWLLVGIPTDQDPFAGVARTLIDGQSQASLSRAALANIPGASARAWIANGSVLVVAVQAPDELIDGAERAVRDLMGRIARGEIPDAALREAAREADENEQRELSDPRTRLRRLVFGGSLDAVALSGPTLSARFKAFGAKAFPDKRWVVVVAHPS